MAQKLVQYWEPHLETMMMGSQKVQLIDLRFGYGMEREGNVVHQSEDAADGCYHHRRDPLLNEESRWMRHHEL